MAAQAEGLGFLRREGSPRAAPWAVIAPAFQAPALVISGDAEVVRAEHALALSRTLPHAQLAILPGGHGDYIGEICAADKGSKMPAVVAAMIDEFLTR